MTEFNTLSPIGISSCPLLAGALSLVVVIAAIATSAVLCRNGIVVANLTSERGRVGCLDGLRGFLAVGVMVHHCYGMYSYFVTGQWTTGESILLERLGTVTVSLFFMITGLLFTDRALAPRIDWVALYASRAARLTPLYFAVVFAVFISAMSLTGWHAREPPATIGLEVTQWLTYVIFGRPDINRLPETFVLIAGVNWTLKYEWMFYVLAVPAVYWCSRIAGRTVFDRLLIFVFLIMLMTGFAFGRMHHGIFFNYFHFLCGMIAAIWIKSPSMVVLFQTRSFRIIATLSAGVLLIAPIPFDGLEATLTLIVFLAVATGTSFAGLLNAQPVVWLGDVSYGVYLLHGLCLFWACWGLRRHNALAELSIGHFYAVSGALAIIVTFLASSSYLALEKPFMRAVKLWIKDRIKLRIPVTTC